MCLSVLLLRQRIPCLILCAIAGQWRYSSSKLKTIWSKQHGGSHYVPATAAVPAEQEEAADATLASAADDAAPTDASGRSVLLKSAEELSEAFWKDSSRGKQLLAEVSVDSA
jgi:hypothetical protein